MAILLVILIVLAGVLIALLNGSDGHTSAFGDSLTLAIIVAVAGLAAILIKLMIDDYQAGRLHGGKPRLKFSRRRARPYLRRAGAMIIVLLLLLAGYRLWQQPPEPAPTTEAAITAPLATQPSSAGATATDPVVGVDASQVQAELRNVIDTWLEAWSSRRTDAYLGHYSPGFQPADGLSRSAWEALRRERLGKARDISIRIEQVAFGEITADRAEVGFIQHYQARGFAETTRKSLSLERGDTGWRIVREQSQAL